MALCLRTKTEPMLYVHEIRGVIYVSWVVAKDKGEALNFPSTTVDRWRDILSEMTDFDLEVVVVKP